MIKTGKVNRRWFVTGSLLTLAGCGGATLPGQSVRESESIIPRGLLTLDQIRSMDVRAGSYATISSYLARLHAAYPVGSNVYYYGQYLVQDGSNYASFPAASLVYRDSSGLHVTNSESNVSVSFSATANIVWVRDAGEYIVRPSESLNANLQQQLLVGTARHAFIVVAPGGGGCNYDGSGDDGGSFDCSGGGGSSAPDPGQITSGNNSCQSGGENVGLSYTVPNDYSSNVTVTQCANNGTTNACFSFFNQVPGSSHNVSIWLNGKGAPSVSMGIISGGSSQEGIGSISLPGC